MFESDDNALMKTTVIRGRTIVRGVDDVAAGAREVIRAYRDVGMRVSYSYGLRDQNRIVYADDETFYARLPRELSGRLRTTVNALALSAEDNLEVFRLLSGEFAGAGDVTIQLAPLNFQWCSDRALDQVAALSHERGTPVHLHLLETPYQRAYARRRTGGSALGHLDRSGMGPSRSFRSGAPRAPPRSLRRRRRGHRERLRPRSPVRPSRPR